MPKVPNLVTVAPCLIGPLGIEDFSPLSQENLHRKVKSHKNSHLGPQNIDLYRWGTFKCEAVIAGFHCSSMIILWYHDFTICCSSFFRSFSLLLTLHHQIPMDGASGPHGPLVDPTSSNIVTDAASSRIPRTASVKADMLKPDYVQVITVQAVN